MANITNLVTVPLGDESNFTFVTAGRAFSFAISGGTSIIPPVCPPAQGIGSILITIVSPPVNTLIQRTDPIVFIIEELIATVFFRRPLPTIIYPGLRRYETIHNGDAFTPGFSDLRNSVQVLQASPPRWQYTVYRPGGWPDSVITLVPYAFDTSGVESP